MSDAAERSGAAEPTTPGSRRGGAGGDAGGMSDAAERSGAAEAEVLAAITEMLRAVIGEDELLMVDEVTMATSFNEDLELESIEFVALAEELQTRYGEKVDFVGWIADLELDQLVAMTVGELVDFVAGCLTAEPQAG